MLAPEQTIGLGTDGTSGKEELRVRLEMEDLFESGMRRRRKWRSRRMEGENGGRGDRGSKGGERSGREGKGRGGRKKNVR